MNIQTGGGRVGGTRGEGAIRSWTAGGRRPWPLPATAWLAGLALMAMLVGLTGMTAPAAAATKAKAAKAADAAPDVFIAGVHPDRRPEGAPVLKSFPKDAAWYDRALHGISEPYPYSLRFLEDQGAWYTPFIHPGMTPPYDIRGWHRRPDERAVHGKGGGGGTGKK